MQGWIILSVLAGLASNGFNITNRLALKNKGDPTAYGWWFEIVRTVFFLFVFLKSPFTALNFYAWLQLLLVGLAELFSVYVFMKMHSLNDLSISSVISRLRIVWSPLLAWLLIGERLTGIEYLGIVTIFLGIVIVSSPKEIKADRGIKTALIFSFSSALLSTIVKSASSVASSDLIIIAQGVIPIFVLPVLMKNGFKRIVGSVSNSFFQIIIAGAFNILSSYLMVESFRLTDASKVVGIYQAMTIFSVFYGIFVLNERDKIFRKIVGTIIVIIGIVATVI